MGANPIGAGDSTPLADRDDDGKVTVADIVIVDADFDGDGTNDISIANIFGDPARGNITFQIEQGGLGGEVFNVRYATPGPELSRTITSFKGTSAETISAPDSGLTTGESITVDLSNVLRDTNDDGWIRSDDITNVGIAATATVSANTDASPNTATFTATATTEIRNFTVDYLGNDSLAPRDAVASGDAFSVALSLTLLDTNGRDAVETGDITVLTGDATLATADAARVGFVATKALTTSSSITVRYLGQQSLSTNSGLTNGEAFTLALKAANLPLQDTDGSGAVSTADITIRIGTRTKTDLPGVTSFGTTDVLAAGDNGVAGGVAGRVISLVHSGDTLAAGTDIKVEYDGLADLLTVKGANGVEIPIRMLETGAATGIYKVDIVAVDGSVNTADNPDPTNANFPDVPSNLDPLSTGDAADPRIAVIDGGAITVTYRDRNPVRTITVRVQVEKEAPSFSNTTPANNARTNALNTVLSTEATDSIAGVNGKIISSVNVLIDGNAIADASSGDISVSETSPGSGVFLVEYNINKIQTIKDAIADNTDVSDFSFTWEIKVKDKAGNEGSSGERTLTVDTVVPKLTDAFTGDNYDPTEATGSRLRGARRPDTTGSAKRNSVRVVFDQPMDATTFQASDFVVSGDVPVSVATFAVKSDDPDGLNIDRSVFLTMANDFAPDATPSVELVAEVKAAAGNPVSSGTIAAATDGISPTLTVTITPAFGTGDITVGVVADEKIAGSLPTRLVDNSRCVATTDCTGDSRAAGPINQTSKIVTERLEWTFKMEGFDVGSHSIIVRANDAQGNEGTSGSNDSTASGALVFEIDTALPAPRSEGSVPEDNATDVPDVSTFVIEIDWTTEGGTVEYIGDTHSKVTLTKAILDEGKTNERNVLALSSTRDDRQFSIAITNIGTGKHVLTYSAKDELGNKQTDLTLTFTVVEPPGFKLTLGPGFNLVSIPGDPKDGDINTVFGAVEEITFIFTRPNPGVGDPDVSGFLFAERDATTGKFEPTNSVFDLKTIDGLHAYWIESSATVTVDIQIPPLSARRVPPTIPVMGGEWNLVPVISLLPPQRITQGTEFDANGYLGPAADWTRAWTFSQGGWTAVSPGATRQCVSASTGDVTAACGSSVTVGNVTLTDLTVATPNSLDDGLQVGRGYWVLFTKDGFLSPGTP